MVDWDPKDELGLIGNFKFKLGRWVQVSSLPKWVEEANEGYYEGYIDKYGQRPYNVEKTYTGKSLEYKIYYKGIAQGKIDEEYYVRLKR